MQDQPDRLTTAAQLEGVRLVGAEVRTSLRSRADVEPVVILFEDELDASLVEGAAQRFLVRAQIRVSFVPKEDMEPESGQLNVGAEPVVVIDPDFELVYVLPNGEPPTESELRSFASGTALFNVWPYLREFVQSTLARMDLPQIAVPLLRRRPVFVDKEEGQQRRANG